MSLRHLSCFVRHGRFATQLRADLGSDTLYVISTSPTCARAHDIPGVKATSAFEAFQDTISSKLRTGLDASALRYWSKSAWNPKAARKSATPYEVKSTGRTKLLLERRLAPTKELRFSSVRHVGVEGLCQCLDLLVSRMRLLILWAC